MKGKSAVGKEVALAAGESATLKSQPADQRMYLEREGETSWQKRTGDGDGRQKGLERGSKRQCSCAVQYVEYMSLIDLRHQLRSQLVSAAFVGEAILILAQAKGTKRRVHTHCVLAYVSL